jgi:hypothetical protein
MPMRVRRGKELVFGHGRNLFAEELDASLVGAKKSVAELEQDAFADAGGAEKDARLPGATEKVMSSSTGLPSKEMETLRKARTGV